jgi:hypothetical protein
MEETKAKILYRDDIIAFSVPASELDSIKALFTEKEKELTNAVAKVEELSKQLEELRRGSSVAKDNKTSASTPSLGQGDLERLRQELMVSQVLACFLSLAASIIALFRVPPAACGENALDLGIALPHSLRHGVDRLPSNGGSEPALPSTPIWCRAQRWDWVGRHCSIRNSCGTFRLRINVRRRRALEAFAACSRWKTAAALVCCRQRARGAL